MATDSMPHAHPPRRLIAIDTSASQGSVAAIGEGVECVERLPVAMEHARLLAPAVVAVAERAGWSIDSVDCVAVVRGPGSFTGLRVGVTAAKAIAWTCGSRIVGVSAVDAITRGIRREPAARPGAALAIAFDAGRGEVHASDLRLDEEGAVATAAPGLREVESWLESLVPGTIVAGPALEKLADRVAARGDLVVTGRDRWYPFAPLVAEAAMARAVAGDFDDPRSLVPEYIRPSYAEEPRQSGPR
jgi:tRNA threonylcarbamoyladenosine biosynthesis protein TsaB